MLPERCEPFSRCSVTATERLGPYGIVDLQTYPPEREVRRVLGLRINLLVVVLEFESIQSVIVQCVAGPAQCVLNEKFKFVVCQLREEDSSRHSVFSGIKVFAQGSVRLAGKRCGGVAQPHLESLDEMGFTGVVWAKNDGEVC